MTNSEMMLYYFPPLSLLDSPCEVQMESREDLIAIAEKIVSIINGFGIHVLMSQVIQGVVSTRYMIQMDSNTTFAQIAELNEDITMRLGGYEIYISPSQGNSNIVNIDIPNKQIRDITLRELFASDEFKRASSKLSFALGKDMADNVIIGDISDSSLLLITGTIGSGKSICLHSIIMSILYKATPDAVKFLMIDPPPSELTVYRNLPHLLLPVVSDPKKAAGALNWAVTELIRRLNLFKDVKAKNLSAYNNLMRDTLGDQLPFIVIAIEELSDLNIVSDEIQSYFSELIRFGKTVGIHLIISTSYIHNEIISKFLKINELSKINLLFGFDKSDAKIMGFPITEKLYRPGDMLYVGATNNKTTHLLGAFVSDSEVEKVANFIHDNLNGNHVNINSSNNQIKPPLSKVITFEKNGKKTTTTPQNDANSEHSIDILLSELNALVGLQSVKQEVNSLINLIKIRKLRQEKGFKQPDISHHLIFCGNPGTGKTTVARLMSKIYKELGILSSGHLIEVERSDLVAGYVGQTAIKTKEVIERAKGGILFIDEAYTLSNQSENDFGHEAIDTLLKNMEDNKADLIVIAAGYNDKMGAFLSSNPGLRSRFNKFIIFDDYSADELYMIFDSMCKTYDYELNDESTEYIQEYFKKVVAEKPINFANGRFVRNCFEKIIENQSNRLVASNDYHNMQEVMLNDIKLPY